MKLFAEYGSDDLFLQDPSIPASPWHGLFCNNDWFTVHDSAYSTHSWTHFIAVNDQKCVHNNNLLFIATVCCTEITEPRKYSTKRCNEMHIIMFTLMFIHLIIRIVMFVLP